MSVNSRLKAIYVIGQGKAFYGQRIPESSCVRKETVDINILVTSRNGDRKMMQSMKKKEKGNGINWVSSEEHQSNAYRNDLSWAYFDDEPRVHFYSLPNNSK